MHKFLDHMTKIRQKVVAFVLFNLEVDHKGDQVGPLRALTGSVPAMSSRGSLQIRLPD